MAVMEWNAELELGLEPMDQTHREFVTLLNELNDCGDAELAQKLEQFAAHTVAHFEQENHWMQRSGFPPIGCHMGEHARVLALIFKVVEMVKVGLPAAGRVLIAELPAWFENHAATMDHALAYYIRESGFDVGGATAATVRAQGDSEPRCGAGAGHCSCQS